MSWNAARLLGVKICLKEGTDRGRIRPRIVGQEECVAGLESRTDFFVIHLPCNRDDNSLV